jgi:uncharacterized protein YbjT (DUF2867 family)
MARPIPVLVAGATGRLGFEIAKQLSRQAGLQVNALIRPGTTFAKQAKLNALRQHNVNLIGGDLHDRASLDRACQNIEIVVSAVNGDAHLLIDGQTHLIQAAVANGVRRFIPSDYGLDYRQLDWGDHHHHDCRKIILALLQGCQPQMAHTLILSGIWMETLCRPDGICFNTPGQFQYWGDGDTAFDVTSLYDVAAYTAAAVLDEGLANQALAIAADRLTLQALKTHYETHCHQPLADCPQGNRPELLHWLIQQRDRLDPATYRAHQTHYALIAGKGTLNSIAGDRYPQIRPITLADYLRNQTQQKTAPIGAVKP